MWFLSKKEERKVDFGARWKEIEELLRVRRDSALKQALLQADKLLDLALKEKKLKGETLGTRLKEARYIFEPRLYQRIWDAHKLRNRLVHGDEEILSFQIEKAIKVFKEALQVLRLL